MEIASIIIAGLALIFSISIFIKDKIYRNRLYKFIKLLSVYAEQYKTISEIASDLSISEVNVSKYLLDLLQYNIVQINPQSAFESYTDYEWRLNFLNQDL